MAKFLFCLCFFLPYYVFSQANDEELAAEFLNNKEYEKSAVLYEKLLKKNHSSPYYYQNLIQSLNLLPDIEKPFLVILSNTASSFKSIEALGYPYISFELINKSDTIWNRAINKIKSKVVKNWMHQQKKIDFVGL